MNEQKDNELVLFNNHRKERDTQPDMTGKGMVNGRMVFVSAWKNVSKNGVEYWNIKTKNQDEVQQPAQNVPNDLDDQVPF